MSVTTHSPPIAETWENLHFYPPLLYTIGMLRRELRLRCCFYVVVINIYTRQTDRRNADLKIGSTSRHNRRMKSVRGAIRYFPMNDALLFREGARWCCTFLGSLTSPSLLNFHLFFEFQISVFLVVISCDSIWGYQCFRGAGYFQLQDRISTVRAETAFFSETLIFIGKTTRRHKPEHNNLNEQCH